MFETFTDRPRRVVALANDNAWALNHDYLGTEHLLLGLIEEGEGGAADVLESLGIAPDVVAQQVKQLIGHGSPADLEFIPFTPGAKTVLELSLRE